MALGLGCTVKMLRVVDPQKAERGALFPAGSAGSLVEHEVSRAEQYLDTITARFAEHGISASQQVRVGNPVKEILGAADEFGCDIITIATRSRGKVGKLVLGSVADAVVKEARVPVLLYRVAA
jgi:nucleotide-binding universal stress UspA family protein